jgi:hypothetical protein
MTDVYVNVIKHGEHMLVAVCDVTMLGKILKHGALTFEVKKSFYGNKKVKLEEAIDLIKNSTSANLVGHDIVNEALKERLVHPNAVMLISGVPHAQLIKF